MADFYKGQRVRILTGTYRQNGGGIYIEACGKVSCRVKVNGDNQQERTLRLSSIEPFSPIFSSFRKSAVNDLGEDNDNIYKEQWKKKTDSRLLLETMMAATREDIKKLQERLEEMQRIMDNMN